MAELLGHQGEDGEWPDGRWTASTWTLLLLVALGLPDGYPAARRPLERLLGQESRWNTLRALRVLRARDIT